MLTRRLLTNSYSQVLRYRGLDQPPAATLEALHAAWGVDSDAAAAPQLASFALCSWLTPEMRLQAGRCQSTSVRFDTVMAGLRERRQLAEAELAVEGALAGYTYNALGD